MSNGNTVDNTPRPFSGPFQPDDHVQLTGPKNKMHTITLRIDGEFHSHRGVLRHNDILGQPDGSVITNTAGEQYLALRPLLSDFAMSMPRGAAIIYPKDSAQIITQADIFPGATVVEAGVGSGALSLWLLRAIGPTGRLASYERRDEFATIARGNVEGFLGYTPENWSLTVGDLQESLQERFDDHTVDRVVLDMLAPWECVEEGSRVLKPGGVILCYVATATQLSRVAEAIRSSGEFTNPASSETMVRGWHVEGLAVRPDHRMIAHTGFLITARRLAPGTVLPELKRRPSKQDYSAEDVEAWTPGALGLHDKSDKSLRKKIRQAESRASHSRSRRSVDNHKPASEVG
ncbi:tRNA (adenine-N1)-methyltransferase [Lysinibacter sp. HNR]|uniref:tRNA (adenine-N1)-methyltransferase n=1 Tax=Lysinibacter sp. HNR TaxID=3031408 RepID=UPI002435722E|nr:tRNA (adenine-N1)-methyltransferase [Lysinibacter sp. HNR]WGD36216.1 tRNA (adenine-N1)-methyltransferase [Lysinibacter sp. HNR]